MDRYNNQVASLLHFDGNFQDECLTSWQNPELLGFSAGKFGQALSKAGNQQGIYAPNASFDFGSGDFTIECWFYLNTMAVPFECLVATGTTSWRTGAFHLMVSGDTWPANQRNRIHFGGYTLSAPMLMSSTVLTTGQWYHVAITRQSGVCRLFLNGTMEAQGNTSASINFSDNGTWIGSNGWDGANSYFDGRIDEVRITRNIARYTESFSPPIAPFEYTYTPLQAVVMPKTLATYEVYRREYIAGTTYIGQVLAPFRKVQLHDRRLGKLVAEQWSDANGQYRFNQLDPSRAYYVVALDTIAPGQYNAVIQDVIYPTE